MRAILEQSLFETKGISHSDIVTLIRCCDHNDHHIVLTEPAFRSDTPKSLINLWLARQSPELRDELTQTLEKSQELNTRASEDVLSVNVRAVETSDWEGLNLSLKDAIELFKHALEALLENSVNDLAFLKCLAPKVHRDSLEKALEKGWIAPNHRGGLGDMKNYIEALHSPLTSLERIKLLRCWVMCDRDADVNDCTKSSKASDEVVKACHEAQPSIRCLQLQRRSIENFLPPKALQAYPPWNALEAAVRRDRRIYWYYSMKGGLLKDLAGRSEGRKDRFKAGELIKKEELDSLFQSLTEKEMQELAQGFGKKLGKAYSEVPRTFSEQDFQMEYDRGPEGQPTRDEIINSLLNRI